MLRNLTIHGFKSIRQETKIEFGKVNLFIGGNGVGKSNILEALGMLSACFGTDISANELQKKGVRLSVPTLFKSAFKNSDLRINFDLNAKWDHDIEYDVSISASETSEELNFFSEHLRVGGEKIIGRSNHGFSVQGGVDKRLIQDLKKTRGLWDRFQDIVPIAPDLEKQLNTLTKFAIYSPQTAFLRGTDIEANPVKPLGLNGGGLANAANALMSFLDSSKKDIVRTKLLREVIDVVWAPGWTDQINVNKRDPSRVSSQVRTQEETLYFMDKYMNIKRNYLSAYDSSEGTLYLLFVAVLLLHPDAPEVDPVVKTVMY